MSSQKSQTMKGIPVDRAELNWHGSTHVPLLAEILIPRYFRLLHDKG